MHHLNWAWPVNLWIFTQEGFSTLFTLYHVFVVDINWFYPYLTGWLHLQWDILLSQSQFRTDSRFAPSQWEAALLCNDVSHWLGASQESALQLLNPDEYGETEQNYVPISWDKMHLNKTYWKVPTLVNLYNSLSLYELQIDGSHHIWLWYIQIS